MNSLIQLKTTTLLVIPMVLACLAFLPRAQAVSPPPDGGYSGFNTAEGVNALLSLDGSYNTAVGENALVSNTTGSFNMALGQGALASNIGGNGNTAMGFQALHGNTASGNVAVGY